MAAKVKSENKLMANESDVAIFIELQAEIADKNACQSMNWHVSQCDYTTHSIEVLQIVENWVKIRFVLNENGLTIECIDMLCERKTCYDSQHCKASLVY